MVGYTAPALAAILQLTQVPGYQAISARPHAEGDASHRVVLIVIDDIGRDYIGAYGGVVATPHIDRLARQGMLFHRAYTDPLCSPTRANILTGRYGFRTGVEANLEPDDLVGALPTSEITIPEAVAGKVAGLAGKWHLGQNYGLFTPIVAGFDFWTGTLHNLIEESYFDYQQSVAWPWYGYAEQNTVYSSTRITNDALGMLDGVAEFLMVAYHAAHKPYHNPWHPRDPCLHPDSCYKNTVEFLDQEIGRLLAAIDLRTTTVILLSDNGTIGARSLLGRSKGWVNEAGINVPLIIAGGITAATGESDAIVNMTDLHATIVEILGGTSTADDSISLVPILDGTQTSTGREIAYAGVRTDSKWLRAAVERRYKLIQNGLDDTEEFYDLVTDPAEKKPLEFPLGFAELQAYNRLSSFLENAR
jgi:arylsulfatase A-like enzyme